MPADVLALFDLDHTLVPHDSDEQWVAFLIDEGVLDREHYDATNRELIARFNRGEASAVEFTEFYLSTVTRLDDVDLEHRRERFIASRIRPRISASARELVERHRAAGDLVVLTTAVMRFLAQPIAAEFGTLYTGYGPEGMKMTVAMPIEAPASPLAAAGPIRIPLLPAERTLRFTHHGPYRELMTSYGRITEYLIAEGLMESEADWDRFMPMWEEWEKKSPYCAQLVKIAKEYANK